MRELRRDAREYGPLGNYITEAELFRGYGVDQHDNRAPRSAQSTATEEAARRDVSVGAAPGASAAQTRAPGWERVGTVAGRVGGR